MSSTWFKDVRALQTNVHYGKADGGYNEINYILIANTAESNLYNYNGGHDYNECIIAEGEYFEVMRKVCQIAVDFDSGSAKWKPNNKDSCGFIRMCKKAIESAVETNVIPYNIRAIMMWNGKKYHYIFELFENKANVIKEKFYGEDCLTTRDVATYTTIKRQIWQMIRDYNERVIDEPTTMSVKDWIENHKSWYKIAFESN